MNLAIFKFVAATEFNALLQRPLVIMGDLSITLG